MNQPLFQFKQQFNSKGELVRRELLIGNSLVWVAIVLMLLIAGK